MEPVYKGSLNWDMQQSHLNSQGARIQPVGWCKITHPPTLGKDKEGGLRTFSDQLTQEMNALTIACTLYKCLFKSVFYNVCQFYKCCPNRINNLEQTL